MTGNRKPADRAQYPRGKGAMSGPFRQLTRNAVPPANCARPVTIRPFAANYPQTARAGVIPAGRAANPNHLKELDHEIT